MIVSYGAGVNSTAMILLLLERKEPIEAIVFADTGAERPVSLDYLAYFADWLKTTHGIEIVRVRREGEGLPDYCRRYNFIPSRLFRWCTDKFKVRPLTAWKLEHYPGATDAIGFDCGESHRMLSGKNAQGRRVCYPLIEAGLDRDGCVSVIRTAGLRVPEKSGCWLCPFQRLEQWAELEVSHPDLFARAIELERVAAERSDGTYVFGRDKWDTLDKRVARFRKKKCSMRDLWDNERPCGCIE